MKKRRKKPEIDKRPLGVFLVLCIFLCGLVARIASIQSDTGTVGAQADERYVCMAKSRGYIYDRNMEPLVNDVFVIKTAVIASPSTAGIIQKYSPSYGVGEKSEGVCVILDTDGAVEDSGAVLNIRTVERYSRERLCAHITGYINAAGKGISGIEKSFDKILTDASGETGVIYTVNGLGKAIAGGGLKKADKNYNSPAGVVLTVDKKMQQAAEDAVKASSIERGAAVVLDAKDCAVLALVSVPVYDTFDIASSLTDPGLPFLNRALEAYPVGSVFKPFIAVSAIENGVSVNSGFVCHGVTRIGNIDFGCYNRREHGEEGLNEAVCNSCNTFFIDLGFRTGADNILETAKGFGFGEKVDLTGSIVCSSGNLPDENSLSAPAALANFCFGQGELLATPLQLAAAYAALANGGIYNEPYILKALVDENAREYAYYKSEISRRAADAGVCAVINEALRLNITDGTGVKGCPENVSAAGKTATAQTGQFDENGREKLCTWFCGFVPYEEPEYVVVVFNEDGSTAAEDCAPVFKSIAESVAAP